MTQRHGRPSSPTEIADAIEAEIRSGQRAPHAPLRSRSAMAEFYGVSESTIYAAVDKLKDRGMVYGKRGVGVFVAGPDAWRPMPPT